jgi:glycosyltransferase involved in cell wall biosynthesis
MFKMNPRHSILVITYKQQDLVGACLDSILSQSVKPYEVVIIDDCSPDGTWNVIQEYAAKYPGIIRPIRNERNVGVFANMNNIKELATGDIVNFVAGDDLLPPGILAAYNQFIAEKKLQWSDPFIIYTNADILMPDGTLVRKDNFSNRHIDTVDLTLLCCFYVWDTGISIELLRRMPPIREDLGYQADWLQHFQRVLCSKGAEYFLDAVGYIYRQGVGVTAATAAKKQVDSKIAVMNLFLEHYSEKVSPQARRFFQFEKALFGYHANPSFAGYLKMVRARVVAGKLPKNNTFRRNLKTFVPVGIKSLAKRILK